MLKDKHKLKNKLEVPVPLYEFKCSDCDISFDRFLEIKDRNEIQACPKCRKTKVERLVSMNVSISGTRDSFGIKNAFKNEDGQTIDTWKKWEKAGYRNAVEVTKNNTVKEKIKDKIEKKSTKIQA